MLNSCVPLPEYIQSRKRETFLSLPLKHEFYLQIFGIPGSNNIFVASVDYVSRHNGDIHYAFDLATATYIRGLRVNNDGTVPDTKEDATPQIVQLSNTCAVSFPPQLRPYDILGSTQSEEEKMLRLGVQLIEIDSAVEA